jgi:hypothetical protein
MILRKPFALLALATICGGAFADEEVVNYGNIALANGTTVGTGTVLNFNSTLSGNLRGFFITGEWTGTTTSASLVRAAMSNNAGWSTLMAPASTTVDRNIGGGTAVATNYNFGIYSNIYSSASAPNNTTTNTFNAPALGSNWTLWLRQNTTTAGTYAINNAALHLLTDAVAPMTGNLTANSPTYQRVSTVTAPGAGTLASAGAYKYATSTFVAPQSAVYMVGADWMQYSDNTNFDGWLSLYAGTFDPLNPLTNVIGVDDDAGYGLEDSAMWIQLVGGQSYTMVYTLFSSIGSLTTTGTFTGYVAGPVPEPASIAALGLGALALIRRKRSRKA